PCGRFRRLWLRVCRCENSRRGPTRRVCGVPRNRALARLRRPAVERDPRARRGSRARQCILVAPASIGRDISRQALARLHPALATQPPRYRAEVMLWSSATLLAQLLFDVWLF